MSKSRRSFLHPLLFQNPGYEHGDTLLHVAARHFVDQHKFDTELKNINKRSRIVMSLIANDEGELPVDLLPANSAANKLRVYLYNLMRKGSATLIDQPVKVFPALTAHLDLKLRYNLDIARKVAEQVRANHLESSTHPQMNSYDSTKLIEVDTKICTMREVVNTRVPKDDPANYVLYAKQYKVGNCTEYSYIALDCLKRIEPRLSAEVFELCKGDHVFLVIDRDKNSDVDKPHTWGNSAVVCDAWSGTVFPASEIPLMLHDYKYYEVHASLALNVLSSFNPRYAHLKSTLFQPSTAPALTDTEMSAYFDQKHRHQSKVQY